MGFSQSGQPEQAGVPAGDSGEGDGPDVQQQYDGFSGRIESAERWLEAVRLDVLVGFLVLKVNPKACSEV